MLTPHTLPGGARVMIDSDVLDVGHRLQYGDPTLAWSGDLDLSLHWNEADRCFEVWHISLGGKPYLVCSSDHCDADLIRKVVDRDHHHRDVLAEIDDHNAKVAAAREKRFSDWQDEFAEKFQWALKRDLGAHLGGSGRKAGF